MKLISITDSPKTDKKLMAVFDNDGRKKTTHFGAKGYTDYTMAPHDKEQRDRYRTRHAKDLKTGDPTKAGFLSYYVLWGDSTSRATNISHYKKKFNL
jgi:protein required for attachment to host cells